MGIATVTSLALNCNIFWCFVTNLTQIYAHPGHRWHHNNKKQGQSVKKLDLPSKQSLHMKHRSRNTRVSIVSGRTMHMKSFCALSFGNFLFTIMIPSQKLCSLIVLFEKFEFFGLRSFASSHHDLYDLLSDKFYNKPIRLQRLRNHNLKQANQMTAIIMAT